MGQDGPRLVWDFHCDDNTPVRLLWAQGCYILDVAGAEVTRAGPTRWSEVELTPGLREWAWTVAEDLCSGANVSGTVTGPLLRPIDPGPDR